MSVDAMKQSKTQWCDSCQHLEVWPKAVGGTRYLCKARFFSGHPKEFGSFGYDTAKGVPTVKNCNQYEVGLHYSRRHQ